MKEQGSLQHPTLIHKLIWWDLRSLTPLSMSLAGIKVDDPALIESCQNLHVYFEELLEDMYRNPEAYYMNPGEFEKFLNGRSEGEARRASKKDFANARSRCSTQGFHLRFLYEINQVGALKGDSLIVQYKDYERVGKDVGKSISPKVVNNHTRISALTRSGLIITQDGQNVILSSERHPGVFLAMWRLSRAGAPNKPFGLVNFKCCNFQQITDPMVVPGYQVVTQSLGEKGAYAAERVNRYAEQRKMFPKTYGLGKVNYLYKGKAVIRFNNVFGDYELYVNYGVDSKDLPVFSEVVKSHSQELQDKCLRHANYCRNCGYCETPENNPKYELMGRIVRTCGFPSLRIVNPDEDQMDWIEEVIDTRLETIRKLRAGAS